MRFDIQKLFIDYQSEVLIQCSECFPEVLGKVKLILLLKFPTKYAAEQVSTKYCTFVINAAIVVT